MKLNSDSVSAVIAGLELGIAKRYADSNISSTQTAQPSR